jgi:hypothetical protein
MTQGFDAAIDEGAGLLEGGPRCCTTQSASREGILVPYLADPGTREIASQYPTVGEVGFSSTRKADGPNVVLKAAGLANV